MRERIVRSLEKVKEFTVPGIGTVRFVLRHSCRSLRSAREWKKKYEGAHHVVVHKDGHIYRVYTRRK